MQAVKQVSSEIDRYPVRIINVQGRDFSYREAGDAGDNRPTILLLHGIGSGSGSWVRLFDDLKDQARLVAWDAPGYGDSTPLSSPRPVAADYAAALQSFCKALGLQKFILIGHSLGAIMAARFACDHVDTVTGLILAAPAQGYANRDVGRQNAMVEERIRTMERLGPEGMAQARADKLLSRNAAPGQIDLVAQNMRLLTKDGYAQAVYLLAQGNIVDDVSRYPHPITLLCGSEDNITPPASVREIAVASSQSVCHEIPDAGHACYIDQPALFTALVISEIKHRFSEAT